MNTLQDSPEYLEKKAIMRKMLTIYGRKPVMEALQDQQLSCFRLHLAESNKPSSAIQEMEEIAQRRQIDIRYHNRQALSRISKNSKQDQGVCLDIRCESHQDEQGFLSTYKNQQSPLRLLALDRITNPQNVGMIIRSACAGNIDGILMSEKGSARLDALVIKASAGTLFKAPIIKCDQLIKTLSNYQNEGATIVGLSSYGSQRLASFNETNFVVYILGNETEGMSSEIQQLCDKTIHIPMNNGVESLNVAMTASLLAFRGQL